MIRAIFNLNISLVGGDYRPVEWPIQYPYWCSGETEKEFTIIAFAENEDEIYHLWPEAYNLNVDQVNQVFFTQRFPKPSWYKN